MVLKHRHWGTRSRTIRIAAHDACTLCLQEPVKAWASAWPICRLQSPVTVNAAAAEWAAACYKLSFLFTNSRFYPIVLLGWRLTAKTLIPVLVLVQVSCWLAWCLLSFCTLAPAWFTPHTNDQHRVHSTPFAFLSPLGAECWNSLINYILYYFRVILPVSNDLIKNFEAF